MNTKDWKEEWNNYCNRFWIGTNEDNTKPTLSVPNDFGIDFIASLLADAAVIKGERRRIIYQLKQEVNQELREKIREIKEYLIDKIDNPIEYMKIHDKLGSLLD